jgi:uncharacterized protein YjbI with pentapeptide repeats
VPGGGSGVAGMLVPLLLWLTPAAAAPMTAEQVRDAVAGAPGGKADLSGKDLRGADLTGLDLSGANLAGADLSGASLRGVRLVGTDLTDANLTKADLTFAWIIRADFTHARLRGTTLQTIVTSRGMDNTPDQAARFVNADLSDASITVHFSFDDLRGASFAHAHMTVDSANQSMGLLRTEFMSANLDKADFTGAGLGRVSFRFARLNGARFTGADLGGADFTGAYLSGADFTGANLHDATFSSATVDGAVGLDPLLSAGSARSN